MPANTRDRLMLATGLFSRFYGISFLRLFRSVVLTMKTRNLLSCSEHSLLFISCSIILNLNPLKFMHDGMMNPISNKELLACFWYDQSQMQHKKMMAKSSSFWLLLVWVDLDLHLDKELFSQPQISASIRLRPKFKIAWLF